MMSESSVSRLELLTEARGGNQEALNQLLDSYRNYLALLARPQVHRQLQSKIDASDVVQETCLRVHRDLSSFRGQTEEELTAWLRRVVAYVVANLVRHYSYTQRRDVGLERRINDDLDRSTAHFANAFVSPNSTPSQGASRHELVTLVADAIAELPDHYREVVILQYVEGLPLAEIARRLDKSANSVQKIWARAIVQIRQLLEAHQ